MWICMYCKVDYLNVRLCVYHENFECVKNPKFKHSIQSKKNDDLDNKCKFIKTIHKWD
jgi:hypothetical protein